MGQQTPIKDLFWVVLKSDYLHLYTPDGNEVTGTFKTQLTDEVGEPSELLVQMFVNLADSEEDMLNKIKELNT